MRKTLSATLAAVALAGVAAVSGPAQAHGQALNDAPQKPGVTRAEAYIRTAATVPTVRTIVVDGARLRTAPATGGVIGLMYRGERHIAICHNGHTFPGPVWVKVVRRNGQVGWVRHDMAVGAFPAPC